MINHNCYDDVEAYNGISPMDEMLLLLPLCANNRQVNYVLD